MKLFLILGLNIFVLAACSSQNSASIVKEAPLSKKELCKANVRDKFGLNLDILNPSGAPHPDRILNLNIGWLRIEYKAQNGKTLTETTSLYQSVLKKYKDKGIKILLIIDYTSLPGSPKLIASDSLWERYIEDFTLTAEMIAHKLNSYVDAWQIWNEPDINAPPHYEPGMRPKIFGQMLIKTSRAIRQYSNKPIMTAGLASGDVSWFKKVLDLNGGYAAFSDIDMIAIHPYTANPNPKTIPDLSYNMPGVIEAYERQFPKTAGKKIIISEVGTGFIFRNSAELRAKYLEETYRLTFQFGDRLPTTFWFCWHDAMVKPFGLIDIYEKKTEEYNRYRTYSSRKVNECNSL